jgi:hypothetical protein
MDPGVSPESVLDVLGMVASRERSLVDGFRPVVVIS